MIAMTLFYAYLCHQIIKTSPMIKNIQFHNNIHVLFKTEIRYRCLDSIAVIIASAFTWDNLYEFKQITQMAVQYYHQLETITHDKDVHFIHPLLIKICALINMLPNKNNNQQPLKYLQHFSVLTLHITRNTDLYHKKFQHIKWLRHDDPRWTLIIYKIIQAITNGDNNKIMLICQIISNVHHPYYQTYGTLFLQMMKNILVLLHECNPTVNVEFNNYHLDQIWQIC